MKDIRDIIRQMLRGGRVTLVDDTGPIQKVQSYEGDLSTYGGVRVVDGVLFPGHFGLVSVPPLDAEVLLASMKGDRAQTFALGSNHQASRLKNLEPGDSGLYDVRGAKITLTKDGILIDAAGLPIVVQNFASCTVKGDLHVEGDVVSRSAGTAVSLNGLHDAYNAHKHPGVQAGGSLTGSTDHAA